MELSNLKAVSTANSVRMIFCRTEKQPVKLEKPKYQTTWILPDSFLGRCKIENYLHSPQSNLLVGVRAEIERVLFCQPRFVCKAEHF